MIFIQSSYSNREFQETWKKPGIFEQVKKPGNGMGFRTSHGKPGICVASRLTCYYFACNISEQDDYDRRG